MLRVFSVLFRELYSSSSKKSYKSSHFVDAHLKIFCIFSLIISFADVSIWPFTHFSYFTVLTTLIKLVLSVDTTTSFDCQRLSKNILIFSSLSFLVNLSSITCLIRVSSNYFKKLSLSGDLIGTFWVWLLWFRPLFNPLGFVVLAFSFSSISKLSLILNAGCDSGLFFISSYFLFFSTKNISI